MARSIVILGGGPAAVQAHHALCRSMRDALRRREARLTVVDPSGELVDRLGSARVLHGRVTRVDVDLQLVWWQPVGGGHACPVVYDELVLGEDAAPVEGTGVRSATSYARPVPARPWRVRIPRPRAPQEDEARPRVLVGGGAR